MPEVRRVGQGGPAEWYFSLPPVTRYFATACLLTSLAVKLSLTSPYTLALLWPQVLKLEVWRLLTPFCFLGALSLRSFFLVVWIVQYGQSLETNTFHDSTADFVWFFFVCMGVCLATSLAYSAFFFGESLVFSIIYLYSREVPDQQVMLMGLVPVQSFYLPFALTALEFLLGGSIVAPVIGIIAGHTYYFLKTIYPRQSGRDVLQTPQWLSRAVGRTGIGQVPAPAAGAAAHPSQPGFRAFAGQGRRLG